MIYEVTIASINLYNRVDVYEWCENEIGPMGRLGHRWSPNFSSLIEYTPNNMSMTFVFQNSDDAMLFKMRWL